MSRLFKRALLDLKASRNCWLICPSNAVQIRCNTSMFGSQTQAWSNVKQQSLDEAASKVRWIKQMLDMNVFVLIHDTFNQLLFLSASLKLWDSEAYLRFSYIVAYVVGSHSLIVYTGFVDHTFTRQSRACSFIIVVFYCFSLLFALHLFKCYGLVDFKTGRIYWWGNFTFCFRKCTQFKSGTKYIKSFHYKCMTCKLSLSCSSSYVYNLKEKKVGAKFAWSSFCFIYYTPSAVTVEKNMVCDVHYYK